VAVLPDSAAAPALALMLDPEQTLQWLRHIDVFADVPDDSLRLVLNGMRWIELRAGDVLEDIPNAREAVHIVRYGSLGPLLRDMQGERVEMAPLGPGDIHGEISALAGVPRPTRTIALRHSGLLQVRGDALRLFVAQSHQGAVQLMQYMARSLMENLRPRHRSTRPSSVALVAVAEGLDLMAIGAALADDETRQQQSAELLSRDDGIRDAAQLCAVELVNDLTLLVTDTADPEWTALCIANADRLLYVDAADRPPLPEPPLARILVPGRRAYIDVAVFQPASAATPRLPARWRGRDDVQEVLHLRRDAPGDLGFLARVVTGRAVGLVLAGGGARGYVHLGAVRALREAGFPIDMLGGTSIGGIVAAGVAAGWDDAELLERTRQVFATDNPMNDYTIPLLALTRGDKVTRRLRQNFGERDIQEAWRPFFCVSTDLSASEARIHRMGPFWKALRATCALPGILPPVVEDGHILVDGAIMNNFPVDEMRAKRRGPVIGVDIVGSDDFAAAGTNIEARPGLGMMWMRRLPPINIVSILSRSATTGSLERGRRCRAMADLLIDPPVDHVGLLDWRGLDSVVAQSYSFTRRLIDESGLTYEALLARTLRGAAEP
jgi:NTE family protein